MRWSGPLLCVFVLRPMVFGLSGILRQTTRTLRIFLSHTVSGQVWQTGETAPAEGGDGAVNFETGQGIPAWAIKIEGRLLEVGVVCVLRDFIGYH